MTINSYGMMLNVITLHTNITTHSTKSLSSCHSLQLSACTQNAWVNSLLSLRGDKYGILLTRVTTRQANINIYW